MTWDGNERRTKVSHEQCPEVITQGEKISSLEKNFDNHKAAVEKSNDELWRRIGEIRDKLLQRPSWAVTIVITILCMVTTASITFATSLLKR